MAIPRHCGRNPGVVAENPLVIKATEDGSADAAVVPLYKSRFETHEADNAVLLPTCHMEEKQ